MKIALTTILLLTVSLVPSLAQQQRGPAGRPSAEQSALTRSENTDRRVYKAPEIWFTPGADGLARPNSFGGDVIDIDVANRTILIRRLDIDQEMALRIDPKCKITESQKRHPKRALTLEEVEAGYEIKTIVLGKKGVVTEIVVTELKVKRP
jgi:hypothetical protein